MGAAVRMLTKWADWQSDEKACKPRKQAQLTPEAEIASDFHFIGAAFAFVGFVSAPCGAVSM